MGESSSELCNARLSPPFFLPAGLYGSLKVRWGLLPPKAWQRSRISWSKRRRAVITPPFDLKRPCVLPRVDNKSSSSDSLSDDRDCKSKPRPNSRRPPKTPSPPPTSSSENSRPLGGRGFLLDCNC